MAFPNPVQLRPRSTASGVAQATTGAAVASVALPGGASLGVTLRLSATNATYYAIGPSGLSGSFTGPADMILLPANVVEYIAMRSTDTTLYHLQVAVAGTIQVAVCELVY